ncbi:cysteine peptidase family C39 domain-containing protein [Galbibacter sp. EGI 63066]|uniref:cysteine peptidase family C39 domain-containing protein n=1 Tax=Galbibacter sp. EGI 63066 TaxID=2993559 RepID=UPI002248B92A|nr:cysteine peptidase family C39 domain-containing protein [Galbibacter sp. EGI 63066]MCX2678493.1 cysteine peptidase family C39 domain-containing protein [Galbibacter sp. EGI 63066]
MDNSVIAITRLLKLVNVDYTLKYLKDSVLSHPDQGSLLSISDTLNKYHIENLALKADAKKLSEFPLPCIVQVAGEKGELFYVLDYFSENEVALYDDADKSIRMSTKAFLEQWTGICLLVEKTEDTKEPGIKERKFSNTLLNVLIWSCGILFLTWFVTQYIPAVKTYGVIPVTSITAYFILKCIGLGAGGMLLWFEIDQHNPTLQSFCSGGGGSQKVNCNAVLNSKYSKILKNNLSLSILGFSYFFATITFLLVNGISMMSLSVLGWFSFLMFPVVVISIFYQAVVIKQWCKFCLVIQAVLLGEIGISLVGKFYENPITVKLLPLLSLLLLLPIVAWFIIKPLIEGGRELNVFKRELKKVKNNSNVFEGLLFKSRKITTSTKELGISIENDLAKYHVIKVCNPYCGPCAKAHPVLEELVNDGKINLQILFTAGKDDIEAKPVSHFLAIHELEDNNKTRKVLNDWYMAEHKDYKAFAHKFPMNGELERQYEKIEKMSNWCDTEKITHTPTVFINGFELPKEYSVNDLKEILQ